LGGRHGTDGIASKPAPESPRRSARASIMTNTASTSKFTTRLHIKVLDRPLHDRRQTAVDRHRPGQRCSAQARPRAAADNRRLVAEGTDPRRAPSPPASRCRGRGRQGRNPSSKYASASLPAMRAAGGADRHCLGDDDPGTVVAHEGRNTSHRHVRSATRQKRTINPNRDSAASVR
jgi:hypothetical protein